MVEPFSFWLRVHTLRPLTSHSFKIVAGRTRHWKTNCAYGLRPVPSDEPGDPGQTSPVILGRQTSCILTMQWSSPAILGRETNRSTG